MYNDVAAIEEDMSTEHRDAVLHVNEANRKTNIPSSHDLEVHTGPNPDFWLSNPPRGPIRDGYAQNFDQDQILDPTTAGQSYLHNLAEAPSGFHQYAVRQSMTKRMDPGMITSQETSSGMIASSRMDPGTIASQKTSSGMGPLPPGASWVPSPGGTRYLRIMTFDVQMYIAPCLRKKKGAKECFYIWEGCNSKDASICAVERILELIRTSKADIVALQEHHAQVPVEDEVYKMWVVAPAGQVGFFSNAILIRRKSGIRVKNSFAFQIRREDAEVPEMPPRSAAMLWTEIPHIGPVDIVSCHLAGGRFDDFHWERLIDEREKELQKIASHKRPGIPMIIAGNFNTHFNDPEVVLPIIRNHPIYRSLAESECTRRDGFQRYMTSGHEWLQENGFFPAYTPKEFLPCEEEFSPTALLQEKAHKSKSKSPINPTSPNSKISININSSSPQISPPSLPFLKPTPQLAHDKPTTYNETGVFSSLQREERKHGGGAGVFGNLAVPSMSELQAAQRAFYGLNATRQRVGAGVGPFSSAAGGGGGYYSSVGGLRGQCLNSRKCCLKSNCQGLCYSTKFGGITDWIYLSSDLMTRLAAQHSNFFLSGVWREIWLFDAIGTDTFVKRCGNLEITDSMLSEESLSHHNAIMVEFQLPCDPRSTVLHKRVHWSECFDVDPHMQA
ncbi:unnamed protein product [Vitrella brassicaformis CCMP3155]|uniref:Endonuclease/exonuclease/phosphatase domain-containing protein n=1 Tax=Vitrella brassicaformis (strain CCMP3155) TaxID=1169540 RepID=A0A0G4EK66_VITBC|nr:unnamed protein product [Vitrella brassicaformis CCMP3155]|eukprot:CEL96949.1 unnamed protein product [Vitrella brassicaformis CCMP3155]